MFSFYPVAESYASRDVVVSYFSGEGEVENDILLSALMDVHRPDWLLSFGFPMGPFRSIRVIQTASHAADQWNIAELRVFAAGRELPRHPHWKLSAEPAPWDAPLAFDNNPATRWNSWQGLYPGMYLRADFGTARNIDRVTIECAHDQYAIRLRLEGLDKGGNWRTLSDVPRRTESLPHTGMRRAATAALKSRGTGYLLVHNSYQWANDFAANRDLWNTTLLGEARDAKLYKIE